MKECKRCEVDLNEDQFSKNKRSKDGLQIFCKPCCKASKLEQRFNITHEEYMEILNNQNGKCGICEIHQSETRFAFAVDHCHDTLALRGLLCRSCNYSLGKFGDSEEGLLKALNYLKTTTGKYVTEPKW